MRTVLEVEMVEEGIWESIPRPRPDLDERQLDRMLRDTEMQNAVTSPFSKLIFGSTLLSITRTLASYGIPDGATLTCVFTGDFDVDRAA